MLDLLYKRRSIRKFTDQVIEEEKIDRIMQAARSFIKKQISLRIYCYRPKRTKRKTF